MGDCRGGSAFGPGPDAGRAAERRAMPRPRRFGVFAGAGASPLPGASAQKKAAAVGALSRTAWAECTDWGKRI